MSSDKDIAARVRLFREPRAFTLVIGPWAGRFNFAPTARFANGSRWFSGWHRWRDDAEF